MKAAVDRFVADVNDVQIDLDQDPKAKKHATKLEQALVRFLGTESDLEEQER